MGISECLPIANPKWGLILPDMEFYQMKDQFLHREGRGRSNGTHSRISGVVRRSDSHRISFSLADEGCPT